MAEGKNLDEVSREAIFKVLASEAQGFYRLLLTIASGFLGGSIAFIENIAPSPQPWSLWLLGAGWAFLIVCIGAVAWLRRENIRSGRHALKHEWEEASRVDESTGRLSTWAIRLLALGICFIAAFGMINFVHEISREKKEQVMIEDKVESQQQVQPKIERQIPFGSTKPVSTDSKEVVPQLEKQIPFGSLKPIPPEPAGPAAGEGASPQQGGIGSEGSTGGNSQVGNAGE